MSPPSSPPPPPPSSSAASTNDNSSTPSSANKTPDLEQHEEAGIATTGPASVSSAEATSSGEARGGSKAVAGGGVEAATTAAPAASEIATTETTAATTTTATTTAAASKTNTPIDRGARANADEWTRRITPSTSSVDSSSLASSGNTNSNHHTIRRAPTQQQIQSSEPTSALYYQRLQRLDHDCYMACDRLTKRQLFAVRVHQLEQLDETDAKLLIHDVQLCSQLRHPNIVKYLYNFIHKDQLWIVQPLCSFTSADRLSRPFGLPELAIAFIVRDTLLALDYLHQHNLIHRSVRASHILVKSDGRCLLTGLKYSLNCVAEGKRQPYVHQYPQKARPNIYWFSPEILEQNLFGYNHKSDIYSLGITCCELANGVVPFSDLQPTEMLLDKLTGNAPRLLDSTCQELVNLKPNEMSPEDRDKYYVFRGRQFSSSFHTFTSGLCLTFDPQKRPEARKLLSHNFIKQLKKCPATSMLDLLDPNLQIISEPATNAAPTTPARK